MKYTLILAICLITARINAQTPDATFAAFGQKFEKSFLSIREFPERCGTSAALLRFEIDESGQVKDFSLSDSADSLLRAKILKVMDQLSYADIQKLAREENIRSASILIPFYYSFIKDGCKSMSFSDISYNMNLASKLFIFNGVHFKGKSYLFESLNAASRIDN